MSPSVISFAVILLVVSGMSAPVSAAARAGWSLLTAAAAWSPRAGGVVELYNGSIRAGSRTVTGPLFLLYGMGVDDPGSVEEREQVWYSTGAATTRGRQWTQIVPTRPFSPILSALTVQDSRARQYRLFGCTEAREALPDIYLSTNGGVDWTAQHEGSGPYPPPRYHGAAVVDSLDAVYVLQGRPHPAGALSDVWKSSTQGRSWTQVCATVPWGGRVVNLALSARVSFDDAAAQDVLWAIAGYSGTGSIYHNDVRHDRLHLC